MNPLPWRLRVWYWVQWMTVYRWRVEFYDPTEEEQSDV